MANGGTVSIKNPTGVSLAVTITPSAGAVTFLKSGGGTASFPETITGDETFACTVDSAITVSVKYSGREVAGTPDGTVSTELKGGCVLTLQPSPDAGFDFTPPTVLSTTAALAAVGNAINTTGKFPGKQVLNTTTNKPVWAVDGTAAGLWKDATGTTAHTPV
jgi:hypothetical protein